MVKQPNATFDDDINTRQTPMIKPAKERDLDKLKESCQPSFLQGHYYCRIYRETMTLSLTMNITVFVMIEEPTLYTVKGMAILDNDGNRILAKYYDKNVFPTAKEQKTFEKNLFNKTHRANAEIIMLDGLTCVYRSNVDLFFYVMGSSHENELILMSVLNCLYDSVSHILRKNVEKRVVLENLDIVMLAMDEICDGGIIMEADSSAVVQRVALRTDDIPLGEQTVAQVRCSNWMAVEENCLGSEEWLEAWRDQVLQSAKEQLKWSLLK
uniref:Coatomer subunit zeta n=1 Tax=Timema tahoe TaxID=61484 RepID=A0A7R9IKF4_9NEOP|nr:unnamed protein product [Timema tahoe]